MAVTNNPFLTPSGVKFGDGTIQTSAYANANVANLLPVYGGNISANNIVTVGNITAAGSNTEVLINVEGNISSSPTFTYDYGANLLTAGNISATGNVVATSNINAASFNSTGLSDFNSIKSGAIDSNATITGTTVSATGTIKGSTVSSTGGIIGASSNISGIANLNSVETTSVTATGTITAANISVTGPGAVISGDGSGLTNLVYANIPGANANVGSFLASGNSTFAIDIANTITASNFIGNGSTLDGIVWANITGANANVTAWLGNINGNNIGNVGTLGFGANGISITGNVINGSPNGDPLIIDPDGDGSPLTGNVEILGNLTVSGNLTYVDVQTSYTSNLLWIAAGNATTALQASGAGLAAGNVNGPNALFTFSSTANAWESSISVHSANIISATGNVHGANVSTAGNVIGGDVYSGNVVSATGNVYAGSGAYFIGNGALLSDINAANLVGAYSNANVQMYLASGNVDLAINTGNVISAAGNITGSNLNTGGIVSATGNIIGNNLSITNAATATTVNYNTLSSRTANATQQSVTLSATSGTPATFTTSALKGAEYTWIVESTEALDIVTGDGMSMGKGFLVANVSDVSTSPYGLAQVGANVIDYPTFAGDATGVTFTFTTGFAANVVLTLTQFG